MMSMCSLSMFTSVAMIALGQEAHQAMISEIGSQIDLLQDRVADRLREQSAEHQQHLTEVVASQDDKLADLEEKLYSLGNGVADLEERSNSDLAIVRTDGMFGLRMSNSFVPAFK